MTGKPYLNIRVRTAAEGLRAELNISPSVLDEIRSHREAEFQDVDAHLTIEFPFEIVRGFEDDERVEYRLDRLLVQSGDAEHDDERESLYADYREWDDMERRSAPYGSLLDEGPGGT